MPISQGMHFLELVEFFVPKILFALLCGGIIGLERELKHKAAGIKTNMLICVGAAIYAALSVLISGSYAKNGYYGDPARLVAQVVSGIGFLGGGAIIQSRGTVLGLTTAATIWVVAAIGIAVGMGYPEVGLLASVTVVGVLVAITYFEDRVLGRDLSFACEILIADPDGSVRGLVNQSLEKNDLMIDDFDLSERGTNTLIRVTYRGSHSDHKKFILNLWSTPGIREVKQI